MMWTEVHILVYTLSLQNPNSDQQIPGFLQVCVLPVAFWHGRALHYFCMYMLSLILYPEIIMIFRVHSWQRFMSVDPCVCCGLYYTEDST